MSFPAFQCKPTFHNIVQSLSQLEALQTTIRHDLHEIQCAHEALLKELDVHRFHDGDKDFALVPSIDINDDANPAGFAPHSSATPPAIMKRGSTQPLAVTPSACLVDSGDTGMASRLSSFDPFAVWPVWTDEPERASRTERNYGAPNSPKLKTQRTFGAEKKRDHAACSRFIVLRPSSIRRAVWDMFTMIALVYDICTIPLRPFDFPETYFNKGMRVLTTVFWSMDVYLSFTTAFHKMGHLEMRLHEIAKKYVCSWFLTDIGALAVDYLSLFAGPHLFPPMLIVPVFRLFRLIPIFGNLNDAVTSEYTLAFLGVLHYFIIIVISVHFLGCGWYAMGMQEEVQTWVKMFETQSYDDFAWFYTISLHWAVTQVIGGETQIVPTNALECSYAVSVIVVGLVFFSALVSKIASTMNHISSITLKQMREEEIVRRFLLQANASLDLGNRIQSYFRQRVHLERRRNRLLEKDVPLLSELPDGFLMELRCQVFIPILLPHPFFRYLHQNDLQGISNVCHMAMVEQTLSPHHQLFTNGEACSMMSFVLSGELDYFHLLNDNPAGKIGTGAYLCEMCLWIQWEHQGQLVAKVRCEIVGLNAKQFHAVARKLRTFDSCKEYAHLYAAHIADPTRWISNSVPSDIWTGLEESQEFAQTVFEGDMMGSSLSIASTAMTSTWSSKGFKQWLPRRLSRNFGSLGSNDKRLSSRKVSINSNGSADAGFHEGPADNLSELSCGSPTPSPTPEGLSSRVSL